MIFELNGHFEAVVADLDHLNDFLDDLVRVSHTNRKMEVLVPPKALMTVLFGQFDIKGGILQYFLDRHAHPDVF
jgi:hypothetical protein